MTRGLPAWLETRFGWILLAYFTLHTGLRCLFGNSFAMDEAEQVLVSQAWAGGYGNQPPLYTWLQALAFKLTGVSVLGVAVVKNSLLLVTYYFLYRSARALAIGPGLSALAALSLLLVPEIAYEFQRDRSHLVMATAVASVSLFVFIRLLQSRRTRDYWLLGALIGAGGLSKHNYVMFLVPMVAAGLSIPGFRRTLLDRRIGLTVLTAALVVSPHALWLLDNADAAIGNLETKMHVAEGRRLAQWVKGTGSLLADALAFTGLVIALPLLLFRGALIRRPILVGDQALFLRLFHRYFLVLALLLVAMLWLTQGANFKARWLAPMLFLLPLYLFLRIQGGVYGPWAPRGMLAAVTLVAVIVVGGLAGRVFLGSDPRFMRFHLPFPALKEAIRSLGFEQGLILTEGSAYGAALRMSFADSRVHTPLMIRRLPPLDVDPCQVLLVWEAEAGLQPPAALERFAASLTGPSPVRIGPQRLSAAYPYRDHLEMEVVVLVEQRCP